MTELKDIPGFENYQISIDGKIYSKNVNRNLKSFSNNRGRAVVRLHKDGKAYPLLVHRLLAFVYLDLPSLDSPLEVDHIDGDCTNNTLSNLQVLTRHEHELKTYGSTPSCKNCGIKIKSNNKTGMCLSCLTSIKLDDGITVDNIVYWVTNYSWVRASKELGLSDVGLRKRFTKLSGIHYKDIKSLQNKC